jgi:protease IV
MSDKGGSRGCLWVLLVLLVLALGASIAINFAVIIAGALGSKSCEMGLARGSELKEEWVYGEGESRVARIPVEGPIMRGTAGGLFGAKLDMVENLKKQIKAATDDDSIDAIMLEVNSPGGAVTPTDEIYRALLDFKESRAERRIITFVRDLAASGSYWLAVSGDWVIAERTSVIGSIGVILQSYNWAVLSEKLGVSDTTIKSGANKDLLNPFRATPEEQKQILQAMIDESFEQFKQVILDNREIAPERLDKIADGRVVSAQTALEEGLIDQVGYWKDAVAYVEDMCGEDGVTIIRYKQRGNFFELLTTSAVQELRALTQPSAPRLMSIWP